MFIVYLHDPEKLKERTKVFTPESIDFHFCWFNDSERIVIAYGDKFQVFNVLDLDHIILSVDFGYCFNLNKITDALVYKSISQPKVAFDDRIIILRSSDF